jgi:REP element-mobilizing transposase RayT
LRGYDYSQSGAYFVTICVQDRLALFGEIAAGQMQLNEAGSMVGHWWNKLSAKYPWVQIDEYVVMPNHFHGIVVVLNDSHADKSAISSQQGYPVTLAHMVQWFKTMTTNGYIQGVKQSAWKPFPANYGSGITMSISFEAKRR